MIEADTALDGVLNDMNTKLGQERPSDAIPMPEPRVLSEREERLLQELPRQAGFYWVENIDSSSRNVAFIDFAREKAIIEHWGEVFDATPGGIAAIERWLDQWTVLAPIEPYQAPDDYEINDNYGMF